jgi:hypothetical protein
MKQETKLERRRRNLLDDFWLHQHGDPSNPRSRTRNWRKHMGLR